MKRRKFLGLAGASLVTVAGTAYLLSDRQHFTRADLKKEEYAGLPLEADEKKILYLASLAPSGHNTQPWLIKHIAPYHWIVSNDKTKWLRVVDPMQRETILSIGAFIQNLEYAADSLGYNCAFNMIALSNQDEDVMEVRLRKRNSPPVYDATRIELRRTVRSGYLNERLSMEHIDYITGSDREYFHFFPNHSREYGWINEQTIQANRQQVYRDNAQAELADWMRLSSKDAKHYCDGLTTASMELDGIAGWVVRNFYSRDNIMSKKFRDQGLDLVIKQVGRSGGWLLITSKSNSTAALIESGMRLQRMLLKTREKQIAVHPMTQILEEAPYRNTVNDSIGISDDVQFILRIGYIKNYPEPVSLRRPVESFVKADQLTK